MSDNVDGEVVDTGDVVFKEESVDGGSDRVRRRRLLLSASNVVDAKRRKKERSKVVRVKVTPRSVMKAKKKVTVVSRDAMKLLRARVERSAAALATALEQTSRFGERERIRVVGDGDEQSRGGRRWCAGGLRLDRGGLEYERRGPNSVGASRRTCNGAL